MKVWLLCLWHRIFKTETCYGCSLISIREKNISDEVYKCDCKPTDKKD
jgi:hypothetical protein